MNKRFVSSLAKKVLPSAMKPSIRSVYGAVLAQLEFVQQARRDKKRGVAEAYAPFKLPPPRLRYQVHVGVDPESYVEAAHENAEAIRAAVQRQGRQFDDLKRVLDWGCGPGKVLQGLYYGRKSAEHAEARRQFPELYGCDISHEAVRWAHRNLRFGRFIPNGIVPPLPFKSESFDLVYGISVFTHLSAEHEAVWLKELQRIIKPDGLVIVTVRGEDMARKAVTPGSEEEAVLLREGIVFRAPPNGFRKEGRPDCYGNTYHTRQYVMERYSQEFEICDYVEHGVRKQDVLVLKKRPVQETTAHRFSTSSAAVTYVSETVSHEYR
jgi:SAM-dependent methyltransferase